jgi:hypothetical protein
MRSPHDASANAAGRRRPARSRLAALLLGALAALALAPGCGDDTAATTSVTLGAQPVAPSVPANGDQGPPKFPGGVCERTTTDRKSLPEWARVTVERFIAAADEGDPETMRALFDPAGVDEMLADLRPVARLGLLALEDRY